jgi:protocatechuate 3,4-dioxygenase beta subunit
MDKFGFSDIKKAFEQAGDMRRIILRGTATDTDSCQPVKSEEKSADYLFASRL